MALLQVQRGTKRAAVLAGALAALAVCTDYLAIVSALAVSAWLLCLHPRLLPQLALGALPIALALMGYHTMCFGGPFVTASQMSNAVFMEKDRVLGMFGMVSPAVLFELTFGIKRGLFLQCPVLLLSAVGFGAWIRRAPRDPLAYVCLTSALLYLAANASFNGWHGGSSVGARYLINAIPFLGLALHALPNVRWLRWPAGGALALSLFNMLAVAAVNPLVPEQVPSPLYGYTYQLFRNGWLAPYPMAMRSLQRHPEWNEVQQFAMWNWGELLGLSGLASLLPLLACLAGILFWYARKQRKLAPAEQAAQLA
jgi:hypothetical protein